MTGDRTLATPAPGQADGALAPYLRAIRAHWLLVTLVALAAVAGSVALLLVLPRQYEATASVLVTPLPADDQTFLGLGLLRDTGDPVRTVQTAATILESYAAAELTAERLGPPWDADAVLDAVRVEPQGESNVLGVTASDDDPTVAAEVANGFARAALDLREENLDQQLRAAIGQLSAQDGVETATDPVDPADPTVTLADRLTELEALRERGTDPTLTIAQPAQIPTSAVGAPRWLILAAALLAGLTVGTLAAYAIESINPRVRDQDEFLSLIPAPVLSGVPRLQRRQRGSSLVPTPIAREAYRTLRVQLQQLGDRRTIMITSASSGDGKTTAAVNLAYSMVSAGKKVVLIDFDLRKPEVAATVGIRAQHGLAYAVRTNSRLGSLLVEPPHAPGLQVLPAVQGDMEMLEFVNQHIADLLQAVAHRAEYVIVDTPPLGEISDALQLAALVDDVVIVARPRHTFRRSFEVMRDLLARTGMQPAGLFVVGQEARPAQYGYYHVAQPDAGAPFAGDREPSDRAATVSGPSAL